VSDNGVWLCSPLRVFPQADDVRAGLDLRAGESDFDLDAYLQEIAQELGVVIQVHQGSADATQTRGLRQCAFHPAHHGHIVPVAVVHLLIRKSLASHSTRWSR